MPKVIINERLAEKKHTINEFPKNCTAIDVVIPTRDFVPETLLKSVKENIPVNKLIIVTKEDDKGQGIGVARQMGLEKVTTDFYASIDSDTLEIPRNWFGRLIRHFNDPSVAVASGAPIFGAGIAPLESYYRFLYNRSRSALGGGFSAVIVRTKVIRKYGYPKARSGEDLILHKMLSRDGFRWVLDPTVEIFQPRGPLEELRKMLWWSQGSVYAGRSPLRALYKMLLGVYEGVFYGMRVHPILFVFLPLRELVWSIGFLSSYKRIRLAEPDRIYRV